MTSELGPDLGPERVETVASGAVSVAEPYPWCSGAMVNMNHWPGVSGWMAASFCRNWRAWRGRDQDMVDAGCGAGRSTGRAAACWPLLLLLER